MATKEKAGVATGLFVPLQLRRGSELVTECCLQCPLRFALQLTGSEIIDIDYAVDITPRGVDAYDIYKGTPLSTEGVKLDFIDAAPLLVEQVADVENVQDNYRLVALEEAR